MISGACSEPSMAGRQRRGGRQENVLPSGPRGAKFRRCFFAKSAPHAPPFLAMRPLRWVPFGALLILAIAAAVCLLRVDGLRELSTANRAASADLCWTLHEYAQFTLEAATARLCHALDAKDRH